MQTETVLFRNELRDRYEELLMFDYHFATEHDVEFRLWKFGFYKQIEEFKILLRRRVASGHAYDSVLRAYRAFLLVCTYSTSVILLPRFDEPLFPRPHPS